MSCPPMWVKRYAELQRKKESVEVEIKNSTITKLKTSICDQLAEEMDANYVKLSLSMISDPSDLVGWPYQEFHVCRGDECEWIGAKLIDAYTANGWTITPETRMSYAVPQWIEGLDLNKPTIAVLDDFSRK